MTLEKKTKLPCLEYGAQSSSHFRPLRAGFLVGTLAAGLFLGTFSASPDARGSDSWLSPSPAFSSSSSWSLLGSWIGSWSSSFGGELFLFLAFCLPEAFALGTGFSFSPDESSDPTRPGRPCTKLAPGRAKSFYKHCSFWNILAQVVILTRDSYQPAGLEDFKTWRGDTHYFHAHQTQPWELPAAAEATRGGVWTFLADAGALGVGRGTGLCRDRDDSKRCRLKALAGYWLNSSSIFCLAADHHFQFLEESLVAGGRTLADKGTSTTESSSLLLWEWESIVLWAGLHET